MLEIGSADEYAQSLVIEESKLSQSINREDAAHSSEEGLQINLELNATLSNRIQFPIVEQTLEYEVPIPPSPPKLMCLPVIFET